jgi:hypothetical protein
VAGADRVLQQVGVGQVVDVGLHHGGAASGAVADGGPFVATQQRTRSRVQLGHKGTVADEVWSRRLTSEEPTAGVDNRARRSGDSLTCEVRLI